MVADWQQIETAGLRSDDHIKRFKSEEIEVVKRNDRHVFPIAEGNLRLPEDTKEAFIRRVGHEIHYISAEMSLGATQADAEEVHQDADAPNRTPEADASDARQAHSADQEDYWSMKGDLVIRHHKTPRTTLFVPIDLNFPHSAGVPRRHADDRNVTRFTQ